MVSLVNDSFSANGGARGAFFFDDLGVENDETPTSANDIHERNVYRAEGRGSINATRPDENDEDDDLLIPHPTVRTPSEESGGGDNFMSVKTPWILALECLAFIALEIAVFLVPHFLYDPRTSSLPYYILLYTHGGLWFLVFIFDRILWSQTRLAQSRGYLEFYRSTRTLRQAPLIIASFFNAILILLTTFLQQFPIHTQSVVASPSSRPTSASLSIARLNEDNILQIMVTLEVVPVLLCLAVLMTRTIHFNGLRHPPDVQQEEAMMQSTVPGLRGTSSRDVGFRDASVLNIQDGFNADFGYGRNTLNVQELLEKQSDQIRYLKSHNANLSRKILKLTAELQNRNQ